MPAQPRSKTSWFFRYMALCKFVLLSKWQRRNYIRVLVIVCWKLWLLVTVELITWCDPLQKFSCSKVINVGWVYGNAGQQSRKEWLSVVDDCLLFITLKQFCIFLYLFSPMYHYIKLETLHCLLQWTWHCTFDDNSNKRLPIIHHVSKICACLFLS